MSNSITVAAQNAAQVYPFAVNPNHSSSNLVLQQSHSSNMPRQNVNQSHQPTYNLRSKAAAHPADNYRYSEEGNPL